MLKCNISLDAFAWELDELVVGQGKALFMSGDVSDTENIGQGVWTCQVSDAQEQYEVEFLLRSRVLRKVGCECEDYEAGKICRHMTAGFYALSEKLPKKSLRNEPQTAIPLSKRKVSDFMEILPEDRMDELVLSYARKNRKFALIVRASATPYAQDETDKYKLLLLLVIKQATAQKKISVSGLNFINEVAFVIIQELKNLLNSGNTDEVILFVDDFLKAWPAIKNYELPDKKKPHLVLIQSLKLLEQAISIVMAPELLEQIAVMLAAHVPMYNRVAKPVEEKLLLIISKIATDTTTQNLCAEKMEVLLTQDEISFTKIQEVLSVLVGWQRSPKELASIIKNEWSENELLAYCQLVIEQGHFELLAELVQRIRKSSISPAFAQSLEDYELLIARADGDEGRLIFLAKNNFKKTGKIKYYKILKDLLAGHWKDEARRLFDYFVDAHKPLPAALMLVDVHAWDELLALAEREDDLFFLTKVDKYLLNHKPKETKGLYAVLLAKYFDQHLGEKPADMFVFLQDHLHTIGYSAFAKEIKAWMRKRYGHRPLLKSVF